MADENDEAAIPKTAAALFGPEPTDVEQLQRGYRDLLVRVSNLEKKLDNARYEASEAQWSVRLLRNATVDLLAPIVLIGSAAFLIGLVEADSGWDYMLICASALFAVYWLRDANRNFDEVTKMR